MFDLVNPIRASWRRFCRTRQARGRAGFSSNVGSVNSRRSSSVSSSPSGVGQVMPMTAARRRYSPTVDRLCPVVMAICRSLTPRAYLNLRTSRTFRIAALSAGIGPPLAWPQRAPRPRFDRRQRELQAGLTRVAGFNRNGWPTSVGIGGRIASESLAALHRITQADGGTTQSLRGPLAQGRFSRYRLNGSRKRDC